MKSRTNFIAIILFLALLPTSAQAQFLFSEPVIPPETTLLTGYILAEANTYTPHFYQGRSEPSIGSQLQLHVIIPALNNTEEISYHWKINDFFQTSTPVADLTTIKTVVPAGKTVDVQVIAYNNAGVKIADIYEVIKVTEPVVYFYEVNPLRGNYRTAVEADYILSGNEVTFKAEPFFLNSLVLDDDRSVSWYLNKRNINNTNSDKLAITLENTGERGSAYVDFEIRDYVTFAHKLISGFKIQY